MWKYSWEVLKRFGKGAKFLHWLGMLYKSPKAKLRTNGTLSDPFLLQRGTRQGCPLSPSLFALTLEPLAIRIRESCNIQGLRIGPLEEKISLYADDALLNLQDAGLSLWAALKVFNEFEHFSGVKINWTKSIVFPLDLQARGASSQTSLLWVEEFKYLGIVVMRDLQAFRRLNLQPIVLRLKDQCSKWRDLPLKLLGHINVLKMLYLPKFKYVFCNCPVWCPVPFLAGQMYKRIYVEG